MNVSLNCTCLLLVWLFISSASSIAYAQQSKRPLVCKTATLRALKAMPKLSYECDAQLNDWDEKILKLPARLSAIKTLESQLSSFTDPDWWAAGEDFSRKGAKRCRVSMVFVAPLREKYFFTKPCRISLRPATASAVDPLFH